MKRYKRRRHRRQRGGVLGAGLGPLLALKFLGLRKRNFKLGGPLYKKLVQQENERRKLRIRR